MLTLNTGLYGRIRRINCAVWGRRSTLAVESRAGGDWGMRMAEATGAEGVIPALSLEDLLVHAGWDRFDFLKCDIEGAEAEVFAASGATIAGMVDCCAVETHDTLVPSSSDMVRATFDPALFSYDRSGEFDVFMRRDISPLPVPPRLSLFRPAIGARDLRLRNVPEQPWAYYMFDVDSCQLHPNERSEPVAEVSTTMSLDGQAVFACRVAVENPLGNAVEFIVEISDELTGRQAALAKTVVAAGAVRDFRVPLSAALSGLHRVALRTIMSEAGATSHQAVASWIEPAFLGGDASPAS
jgi:FkbM family methyltransferase